MPNPNDVIQAIDAVTGDLIWEHRRPVPDDVMEGGLPIYRLAARIELAPGTDQLGTVQAISVETGETAWLYEQRAATTSLVTTGGGLVFGGDVNGRFRAFDQETGEVLWEINLGSPVTGYPITFAVDGRQYVAASTGRPGNASINLRMTPELHPSAGNNLFVFALGPGREGVEASGWPGGSIRAVFDQRATQVGGMLRRPEWQMYSRPGPDRTQTERTQPSVARAASHSTP